ncbi:MAG: hypothetical protein P1U42_02210 [Phycisphaerales bacterium]|nr:hypothetical protein [Phycisphaerales bacterium]
MKNHSDSPKRTSRRGFTVVEMIVTVGILVVVTAGIATIFSTIGDTVARGRKLSELNRFAARVELVMRKDFENMTRDGFLVIVNKNANFGRDVQLYRGEKTDFDNGLFPGFSDISKGGRIRRTDEIMFFTRDEYESARRAISPDMIARSQEAAIYYGHGQKRRPDLVNIPSENNFFFNPAPWDSNYDYASTMNQAGLGITSNTGVLNPNEFARDWSLLRNVTLLTTPIGESQVVPVDLFGINQFNPLERDMLEDSDRQISLQPAQRSIFNSLGWSRPSRVSPGLPVPGAPDKVRWLFDRVNLNLGVREMPSYRASGLVDVVTEDLATIRGMIQALPVKVAPSDYASFSSGGGFGSSRGVDRVNLDRDDFEDDYWATESDMDPSIPDPKDADELDILRAGGVSIAHRNRIRSWMIDALPSRWDTSNPAFPVHLAGVRYEDIPTRLMFNDIDFPSTNNGEIERAYAEANQEMLGSSVFVPMCTEFIVEWSYGFVNNNITNPSSPNFKKMLWYGLDRYIDSDKSGTLDQSDQRTAMPYTPRRAGEAGTDPALNRTRELGTDAKLIVGVDRLMVPGGNPPPLSPDTIEIATFGFNDPRGTVDPTDDTIWQWPKFVRVTMTLADPSERDIEETIQVIFELPELE